MKFHLNSNIVEGTPEELVKYQELLEEKEKEAELLKSGHMHVGYQPYEEESSTDEVEEPSTDIQVGDRVKVLKSKCGAEGEATVTALLGQGDVTLAGTNKGGRYLTNWSNHVSNLEKIEEDDIKGYTFWYLEGSTFNNRNVLKTTLEGYFEDSKGRRYSYQSVHGLMKPLDREDAREEFEEAKNQGGLLKYYPSLDVFIREY